MKIQRQTVAIIAAGLALTYFVILGDAGQRDPDPPFIRILNAVAAGALILIYLLTAPTRADRVDRGVLLGLLLFAAAAVLAQFPRQALDALLTALLYAAAFFVARTLLAVDAGREAFLRCLMALSVAVTFLTAERWLLPALEWWSLTDWSVIPPLDLNLPATPWGHRHDLTLLIVMLYPSWWIGRITPLRAAMATVVGIFTLLIVLVDGSRNLWLAIAAASAALFIPFAIRHWPRDRRRQVAASVALLVGFVVVAASGVVGTVLERILATGSIVARGAMWGPLLDAWSAQPVAGYGPGSFPWVLQLTDYFDTTSWAPRHPDSVIFQLLPEAGLLGVAAVLAVAATLLPAILRGRSEAARWVLIAFALAGLAANPTDFGFLVALAIGWAAFAVPREVEAPVRASGGRRFVTAATLACFAVIAVAWTSTAVADLVYLSARSSIQSGRVNEALPPLELARRLDPGMALYARQLGTSQLLTDDAHSAVESLDAAVRVNPSDDLAWRTLSLAHAAAGDSAAAWAALERAVEIQRSDATNLLLTAKWQLEDGRDDEVLATLGEVLQAWPETVAAPGWNGLLPPGVSTLDVIEVATDRWSQRQPAPQVPGLQETLLTAMAGRSDAAERLAREWLGPSLGPAYVAVMACERDASALLDAAPSQMRRSSLYWALVVRQSRLDGTVDRRAERLLEIMMSAQLSSLSTDEVLNPVNENGLGGFSADIWGYRREPITWPDDGQLPDPSAGAARWLLEPREAVRSAGLDTVLPRCR